MGWRKFLPKKLTPDQRLERENQYYKQYKKYPAQHGVILFGAKYWVSEDTGYFTVQNYHTNEMTEVGIIQNLALHLLLVGRLNKQTLLKLTIIMGLAILLISLLKKKRKLKF